jgi:bifunctional DNA-binding transcriptional regulator/antitoxin component of YhaV-PrlF toxin-antitoxin module
MQTVSIIRKRGQLTIPESIRKVVQWTKSESAVIISMAKPNEIIIKPHSQLLDLDEVWAKIRKARTNSGKGIKSAATFLKSDRLNH